MPSKEKQLSAFVPTSLGLLSYLVYSFQEAIYNNDYDVCGKQEYFCKVAHFVYDHRLALALTTLCVFITYDLYAAVLLAASSEDRRQQSRKGCSDDLVVQGFSIVVLLISKVVFNARNGLYASKPRETEHNDSASADPEKAHVAGARSMLQDDRVSQSSGMGSNLLLLIVTLSVLLGLILGLLMDKCLTRSKSFFTRRVFWRYSGRLAFVLSVALMYKVVVSPLVELLSELSVCKGLITLGVAFILYGRLFGTKSSRLRSKSAKTGLSPSYIGRKPPARGPRLTGE